MQSTRRIVTKLTRSMNVFFDIFFSCLVTTLKQATNVFHTGIKDHSHILHFNLTNVCSLFIILLLDFKHYIKIATWDVRGVGVLLAASGIIAYTQWKKGSVALAESQEVYLILWCKEDGLLICVGESSKGSPTNSRNRNTPTRRLCNKYFPFLPLALPLPTSIAVRISNKADLKEVAKAAAKLQVIVDELATDSPNSALPSIMAGVGFAPHIILTLFSVVVYRVLVDDTKTYGKRYQRDHCQRTW